MRALSSMVVAVSAATILLGCGSEPDLTTGPVRQVYPFEGKVDPSFVGEWHTKPAPSALTLKKDGSLGIVAVATYAGGKTVSKLDGSWRVSGSNLLLKYREQGNGQEVVLKFSASLSADTLKLVQAGNGVKSTYIRKVN